MYRKGLSRNEVNMDDVKPMKSKYIERNVNAESSGVVKNLLICLLTLIVIVLVFSLLKTKTSPKPIYYVSSLASPGMAAPNQIPESLIIGLAVQWVQERYNFTPATFNDAVQYSEKYMTPRFLSRTRAKIEEEQHYVDSARISSTFKVSNDKDPVVEQKKGGYLVQINGRKYVSMGREEVLTQEIVCKIFLKSVPPTEKNKWGLQVDDERQEIIKEGL